VLEEGVEFYEQNRCRNRRVLNAIRGLLCQCYVLTGEVDAAEQFLSLLAAQDYSSPEVARASVVLTLRKEGIQEAQEAYRRLKQIGTKTREDRCQFHLYYGLFLRDIGDLHHASLQLAEAHRSSVTNVHILRELAATCFELAARAAREGTWVGEESVATGYARQSADAVREILRLDPKNQFALDLQEELFQQFRVHV
jgi:hypothetical protein